MAEDPLDLLQALRALSLLTETVQAECPYSHPKMQDNPAHCKAQDSFSAVSQDFGWCLACGICGNLQTSQSSPAWAPPRHTGAPGPLHH